MTRTYTRRFKVRHYELDGFGHVNNAVYANYLQEAAIEASAEAGFDMDWYAAQGTLWIIRELAVRYFAPATYGDEIEVTTWVSDLRRVRSHREYEVRRVSDGERLLRARADWVYVDTQTGRPFHIPDHMAEAFDPSGDLPDIGVRIRNPQVIDGSRRYRHRRIAQIHEIDPVGHVNHANYLRWIEQAYQDAMRAAGHPLARMLSDGCIILQGGHEIEYFAPAQFGDSIEVVSWVCEMGRVRGAWTHEVYNADTGQLLASDYSLGIFLDGDLKPRPLPGSVLKDVLAGHGQ
jgi:acyl-CoA thioester hydrolase